MTELQALILGIVQGLTEFLPISSSGHLILVPWLLDFRYLENHPEFNKDFDVALHFGTLVAVVGYFRHELWAIVPAWFRSLRHGATIRDSDERLAWVVVIGTLPAIVVGAVGEDYIDNHLGNPWQIAILMAVFALVLYWADRRPVTEGVEDVGPKQALKIGAAQALALAPGVSRSGITISMARYLGVDRDGAARISFLLLVPAVLGAVALKGFKAATGPGLPPGSGGWSVLVVGTVAAAISSYAAIWGLLAYVRRHNYDVFVYYRLIASGIILLLIATGVRSATF